MEQFSSRDTVEVSVVLRAVSSQAMTAKYSAPTTAPAASSLLRMCGSFRGKTSSSSAKAIRKRMASRLNTSMSASTILLKMKDVARAAITAASSSSYFLSRMSFTARSADWPDWAPLRLYAEITGSGAPFLPPGLNRPV